MEMELDHSCEKAFFDLMFDISDETIVIVD